MTSTRFLHLRPPHDADTRGMALSYTPVGASRAAAPAGWHADRIAGPLGRGRAVFGAARRAISDLAMFDMPWVALLSKPEVAPGADVVFAARVLGVWTLNTCRIVYVIDDDDGTVARYGFGYGTLAAHALDGEERFLATWDRGTGAVMFEVFKFSRPRQALARLLLPLTRHLQRRFSLDALAAMQRKCRDA